MFPGLELFYRGFLDLTSSRQIGTGGLGPISQLHILTYCFMNGIEGDQADDFVWMLQRLDEKYLTWSAKKHGKS